MYLADMTWYLLIVKIFPYSRDSLSYAIWCKILSINMGCSAFPWFSYCPEFWNSNAKPLKDEEFGRAFFLQTIGKPLRAQLHSRQKEGNDFVKEIQVGRLVKYDQFFRGCHRAAVSPSVRWNMIKFAREHLRNRYMYGSVEVDPWLIRFFWYVLVVCRMSAKPFLCLYLEEEGWTVSRCKWPTSVLLPGKWDFAGCVYVYLQLSAALRTIFLIFLRSIRAFGYLGLALKTKGHSRFFIGIPL